MPNRLISDEKVNCSRQSELDLLKALPIVFMVIIHVYENLSIGLTDPAPRYTGRQFCKTDVCPFNEDFCYPMDSDRYGLQHLSNF